MNYPRPTADTPRWSDLSRPVPDWFTESKLGIFVHWGPYSVPAWAEPIGALGTIDGPTWFRHNPYAEWYRNTIRIPGSPAAEHHHLTHGGAPYESFLDQWGAESFDATEWIDLFQSAGADFVVPVAKHHDGIALWDAPGSGRLTTISRGPRRDIIGELADAARTRGMAFGVYYSGGLDWAFSEELPPIQDHDQVHEVRPVDHAYHRYADDHVRDLIDRYKPVMIWNDINWPDAGKHLGTGGLYDLFSYYRSVVPHGVVNDRWGVPHHDFRTSEYESDADHEVGAWQHTRGLGYSFGHNVAEDELTTMSGAQLAQLWIDVVARGGQLLINVGPAADGSIPTLQRKALEAFGVWRAQLGSIPSRVRAPIARGDDPNGLNSSENGITCWDTPDAVVVFSTTEGIRDVTVPGLGHRQLVFTLGLEETPAIAIVPRSRSRA